MVKVAIIGGGASGLAAAYAAGMSGAQAILFERNEKLGKKIYITGKGRCNFTNVSEDFFGGVYEGERFARSALSFFDCGSLISLIESAGVPTTIERGNRAFPMSGKASDITKAFVRLIHRMVDVRLNEDVEKVEKIEGLGFNIHASSGIVLVDSVILCCGGASYPSTGSDGKGYGIAMSFGHSLQEISPALVSLVSKEEWPRQLSGLSLINVKASLFDGNKLIFEQAGEALFTHTGISGPCILSASCHVKNSREYTVEIDLKPYISEEELAFRLEKIFYSPENKNRQARHSLEKSVPKRLAPIVLILTGIDGEQKSSALAPKSFLAIAQTIKRLRITISGKGRFTEAIITDGGITASEVHSSTMESRLVSGLYIAGEMLNCHGYTGGYNLQLAFSTGILAGASAGSGNLPKTVNLFPI
ncbi:MAG: aminoacetone oxidase family FAD-binding enzyme [Eubacteriaceae bacterium]|nr:aminoacetone oxidase family FAD-binding enzyme [Eubacteriaceae bacterium]